MKTVFAGLWQTENLIGETVVTLFATGWRCKTSTAGIAGLVDEHARAGDPDARAVHTRHCDYTDDAILEIGRWRSH